ncbi:damage-inducible protein J [Limosilactobacillus agrestimuris]|uniref:damage-inducible protein J n=1 Tax=Limosilactobacillus agrestimuris TaxID=2941331 RepID=UPI00203FB072|nr:damage-inducible protein J [Limosilactobacillus agrestimuris]
MATTVSKEKIGSTIRLDPELRKELVKGLDSINMTLNSYFTLAAKQFVIQGKVPFEIKTAPKVDHVTFNEKTRKAIVRAFAEEEGLLPNTAKTFDNTDDAMKELFND